MSQNRSEEPEMARWTRAAASWLWARPAGPARARS